MKQIIRDLIDDEGTNAALCVAIVVVSLGICIFLIAVGVGLAFYLRH